MSFEWVHLWTFQIRSPSNHSADDLDGFHLDVSLVYPEFAGWAGIRSEPLGFEIRLEPVPFRLPFVRPMRVLQGSEVLAPLDRQLEPQYLFARRVQ